MTKDHLPELRPVKHVLHDGQGVLIPLWRNLLPLLPARPSFTQGSASSQDAKSCMGPRKVGRDPMTGIFIARAYLNGNLRAASWVSLGKSGYDNSTQARGGVLCPYEARDTHCFCPVQALPVHEVEFSDLVCLSPRSRVALVVRLRGQFWQHLWHQHQIQVIQVPAQGKLSAPEKTYQGSSNAGLMCFHPS